MCLPQDRGGASSVVSNDGACLSVEVLSWCPHTFEIVGIPSYTTVMHEMLDTSGVRHEYVSGKRLECATHMY